MQEVKGACDSIAHDLRTPLTRLLAGLERARRRARSSEEYVVGIEDAVIETKAILQTFSAMLRISEVESGARRAGFTSVDLTRVVADVVEFYEPLADEKDVKLVWRPEEPAHAMPATPVRYSRRWPNWSTMPSSLRLPAATSQPVSLRPRGGWGWRSATLVLASLPTSAMRSCGGSIAWNRAAMRKEWALAWHWLRGSHACMAWIS